MTKILFLLVLTVVAGIKSTLASEGDISNGLKDRIELYLKDLFVLYEKDAFHFHYKPLGQVVEVQAYSTDKSVDSYYLNPKQNMLFRGPRFQLTSISENNERLAQDFAPILESFFKIKSPLDFSIDVNLFQIGEELSLVLIGEEGCTGNLTAAYIDRTTNHVYFGERVKFIDWGGKPAVDKVSMVDMRLPEVREFIKKRNETEKLGLDGDQADCNADV